MQETWSYCTWFGKCSIHFTYACIVFNSMILSDLTVVINVLINTPRLRLNNQILQKFEVCCMNMLLSLPQHLRVKYFANSVTA